MARPAPDAVTDALLGAWRHLVGAMRGGWSERRPGAEAFVTGVPLPTLNGVWPRRTDVRRADVAELLDMVAHRSAVYCLQLRPGTSDEVAAEAEQRAMSADEEIPLMVLDRPAELTHPGALEIRELVPPEARLHAAVAAAGFESPLEPFEQLMTPAVLTAPGVRCYVGEVDGEAVVTGLGVVIGPNVGVFNVATPPSHRRRGYGAAVTARAVVDGFANGARWAWLQATPVGLSVYEALGFRTVERWRCWLRE